MRSRFVVLCMPKDHLGISELFMFIYELSDNCTIKPMKQNVMTTTENTHHKLLPQALRPDTQHTAAVTTSITPAFSSKAHSNNLTYPIFISYNATPLTLAATRREVKVSITHRHISWIRAIWLAARVYQEIFLRLVS